MVSSFTSRTYTSNNLFCNVGSTQIASKQHQQLRNLWMNPVEKDRRWFSILIQYSKPHSIFCVTFNIWDKLGMLSLVGTKNCLLIWLMRRRGWSQLTTKLIPGTKVPPHEFLIIVQGNLIHFQSRLWFRGPAVSPGWPAPNGPDNDQMHRFQNNCACQTNDRVNHEIRQLSK